MMKDIFRIFILISVFTITILPTIAQEEKYSQNIFPVLTGKYLGQSPPFRKAEIFAPELLLSTNGAHTNVVFSSDGKEAYWSNNGIMYSRIENGEWIRPQLLPFSKDEYNDDAPFLSPDGSNLFFTSKRPISNADSSRKENIWIVAIETNGWSDASVLPPIVNNMFQHWQLSVDNIGNIYFAHRRNRDGNKDLYYSKYINGEYQTPEKLGGRINSEHVENNPFIGPDGDYLIFSRIKDGRPYNGGLFISFCLNHNTWSEPIPLKDYIKFNLGGNCAIVTRDSKYLFFLDSFEGEWERFWVSADFLKGLKYMHLNDK